MNARQFAELCRKEKDDLLREYLDPDGKALVSQKIRELEIDPDQEATIQALVDGILTDAFTTLLCGLDGSASLGGTQQPYTLHDEEGNLLSEVGDLGEAAYNAFHGE